MAKNIVTIMPVKDNEVGFIRDEKAMLVIPSGELLNTDGQRLEDGTMEDCVPAAAVRIMLEQTLVDLKDYDIYSCRTATMPNGDLVLGWYSDEIENDTLKEARDNGGCEIIFLTADEIEQRPDIENSLRAAIISAMEDFGIS